MSHTITTLPKFGYKKTTPAKTYTNPLPMWSSLIFPHRYNTKSACTYDLSQIQTLPIVVPIQFFKLKIKHVASSE